MRRAEIIDRSDQIHPLLQRHRIARQRTPSTGQGGQPLTKGRVEPLDVRRVAHARALGPTAERLHTCGRALHDTAFNGHDTPLGRALHDLGDADVAPRPQWGTPVGSGPDRSKEYAWTLVFIAIDLSHGSGQSYLRTSLVVGEKYGERMPYSHLATQCRPPAMPAVALSERRQHHTMCMRHAALVASRPRPLARALRRRGVPGS
jgi:hypothetical protein